MPFIDSKITVGDEHQSIYGFAGADADSYDKLANLNGDSVRLPLSVCYRCSKAVVIKAQEIVPEIQYAADAEVGLVREGSLVEDLEPGDWLLCQVPMPFLPFRSLFYYLICYP